MQLSFETTGFRDAPETVKENPNQIEGAALCHFIRSGLHADGLDVDDVFPEDHGWAFFSSLDGTRYFITGAIDLEDAEAREWDVYPATGTRLFGVVLVEKKRGFLDQLLGKNKLGPDDPVSSRVRALLADHGDVERLEIRS